MNGHEEVVRLLSQHVLGEGKNVIYTGLLIRYVSSPTVNASENSMPVFFY